MKRVTILAATCAVIVLACEPSDPQVPPTRVNEPAQERPTPEEAPSDATP